MFSPLFYNLMEDMFGVVDETTATIIGIMFVMLIFVILIFGFLVFAIGTGFYYLRHGVEKTDLADFTCTDFIAGLIGTILLLVFLGYLFANQTPPTSYYANPCEIRTMHFLTSYSLYHDGCIRVK